MRRLLPALAWLLALTALAGLAVWRLNHLDETQAPAPPLPSTASAAQVARGAYLAQAGHCAGCHTQRGSEPYAGGRGITTPFGTVYAPNLTPDDATGLGRWSADDFWRALHHGRGLDGRLLVPAFPYPNYTRVPREDADALFAYLRLLPPVARSNRPHELRFPYGTQAALAVWRALYFRPGVHRDDPARSASWNRGAYLVRGLGHCEACHASRNLLGGTAAGGGLLPSGRWYAPSLSAPDEAGVAHWSQAEVVDFLAGGASARGIAQGPMAEVVLGSTQHLSDADLRAMAEYLRALAPPQARRDAPTAVAAERLASGGRLYGRHCAGCHGENGEGGGSGGQLLVPALAGNRIVTMEPPVNLLGVILGGGYAPATARHPDPFGMPPFMQLLTDDEVAAVATFLRRRWGHAAPEVTPLQVGRLRGGIVDE